MSVPADSVRSWQELLTKLEGAAPGSAEQELARLMFEPMRQQAALLQQAVEAQAEFHRQWREQVLGPMKAMLEGFEQVTGTVRAAGAALKEAGELFEQQASAMERASALVRPLKQMAESKGPDTPGGE